MKMKLLGRTVRLENEIPDFNPDDELAFALANAIVPKLINYKENLNLIKERIFHLEGEINEINKRIDEKKEDICEREKIRDNLEKQLKSNVKEIEKVETTIQELEGKLNRIEDDIEKTKSTHSQTENLLNKVKNEIASNKKKISTLEKEVAQKKKEISNLKQSIKKSQDESYRFSSEITFLEDKPWSFFPKGFARWLWMLFFGRKWRIELDETRERFNRAERDTETMSQKVSDLELISDKNLLNVENLQKSLNLATLKEKDLLNKCHELSNTKNALDDRVSNIGLDDLDNELDELDNQKATLESSIKDLSLLDLNLNLETNKNKLAEMKDEYADLLREKENLGDVPKIISGIGTAAYPIMPFVLRDLRIKQKGKRVKTTNQISVFIDPLATPVGFELPNHGDLVELKENEIEVKGACETIDSFNSSQVLINPDPDNVGLTEDFSELGQLYGIEDKLKDAIITFIKISKMNNLTEYELPIVKPQSALGDYLRDARKNFIDLPEIDIEIERDTQKNIYIFDKQAKLIKDILLKSKILTDIINAVNLLESQLDRKYQNAEDVRHNANEIGTNLIDEAFANSHLVRYHYFCPKCNVSPIYLKNEYDLDISLIGEFEQLSCDQIITTLSNYQSDAFHDSRGKAKNKKVRDKIFESWKSAFSELKQLEVKHNDFNRELIIINDSIKLCSEVEVKERSKLRLKKNSVSRDLRLLKRLFREFVKDLLFNPLREWKITQVESTDENEYADKLKEKYDKRKSKGIKLDRFNQNTRLFYSPDEDKLNLNNKKVTPWHCAFCETKFTFDEAKTGSVYKIAHDIKLPVLATLWNDQQVWNQTITLLGNIDREIRDRRVDETDILQAPIDQFLADSRQIRKTIQEARANSVAASNRLLQMADEFNKLGLIDEKNILELKDSVRRAQENLSVVNEQLRDMNEKENEFQRKPYKISLERISPISPVEALSSPEEKLKLFSESSTEKQRFSRLLSERGAN